MRRARERDPRVLGPKSEVFVFFPPFSARKNEKITVSRAIVGVWVNRFSPPSSIVPDGVHTTR